MSNPPLAAMLRTDFATFARASFGTLNPSKPFEDNWHLEALAHHLDLARRGEIRRLLINIPPRSLKSTYASVALPAFILGHNPSAKIICVSYGQDLAADLGTKCRDVLIDAWFKATFPNTITAKKTEDLITTTRGGARLATSIGGPLTGFGGDYIIIDDPLKPEEAMSESARERVNTYYGQTLYSRLNSKKDGVFIVVTQRLHEDDLSGHLRRQGGWTHLNFPAIATEDETIDLGHRRVHVRRRGDPLHPEREPLDVLESIRTALGGAAFEAQFQQNPIPARGNILQRDWIRWYERRPERLDGRVVQSWDTALKGDPHCDFSVCTTWLELNGHHYLIDVFRKQLDFPALRSAAIRLNNDFHPDCVLIEDRGSGTGLIQELKALGLTVIESKPTDDKITRFSNVMPMFEAGQVSFPKEAPGLPDLLHELLAFPNGRNDDQVDSVSQYLRRARDRSQGMFNVDWGWGPGGVPTAEEILGRR